LNKKLAWDILPNFENNDNYDIINILHPKNLYIKELKTIENIEKGRKQEELSDFNKALLKARKFKED
jgi:hypothetical protein